MNEEFEFETFNEQPSLLETEEEEFRRSMPVVRDHRYHVRPGGVWQAPMRTRTIWPPAPAARTLIRPQYTTAVPWVRPRYAPWSSLRRAYPSYLSRRPGYSSWPPSRSGYPVWTPRSGYMSRPSIYWQPHMRLRPSYRHDPRFFQRSFQSAFTGGQGTRDEQVRWVQYALNSILNQNLPVDGVMNNATRTAVRNFQQRSGLPVSGYVGPDTQQALLAAMSSGGTVGTDPVRDMTSAAQAPGPDPGVDASGASGGIVAGASPQNPVARDADARELLEEYGLPLNEFELESEFENWKNESYPGYSLPVFRQPELEMETAATGSLRSTFALVRAIPDDPDYQKYIPFEYRLNAKKIIGDVAQDMKSNGAKAQFWVELIHAGFLAGKIFAEGSAIATVGLFATPVLGLVAAGIGLGKAYYDAGQEIAAKWAATGFARGVVMGADKRRGQLVRDYFGNDYFPPNHFIPNGRSIAVANYRMGLLVGFFQGRRLSENQRAIFFRDLGYRMGDQTDRGPSTQGSRSQWRDWYVRSAAIFRRDHLDR